MKRPELLEPIASLLVCGAADRQIARFLKCSPSTITAITVRLGAHSAQFHELALSKIDQIKEPVDFDHFETFVRSLIERLGIGTAVGQKSWFTYAVEGARYQSATRRSRHRRKLKHTPKPTVPGEIGASTRKVLELLMKKSPDGLELISDGKPEYRFSVQRLNQSLSRGMQIRHKVYINPKRTPDEDPGIARRRNRAMFSVDLLHKLFRHSLAHHGRKTFAFGRKTRNALGRAMVFVVWKNFIKIVSEKHRSQQISPAMRLNLTSRIWTWSDVLAERLFPGRVEQVGV